MGLMSQTFHFCAPRCCPLFSPSNSNEAVAFIKTEGGWKCKHARKSSKNSKINSLLVQEGGG